MAKHEKRTDVFSETEEIETVADERVRRELAETAFSLDNLVVATRGEARPLQYIEDGLNEAIIAQPAAINAIMKALNRRGLRDPNRPTSMIFLGPTGVGKTETPIQLAELLHPEGGGYLQIDCGTYTKSSSHNIAELIGSPPGYRDSERQPLFADKELEKENCVVCFDEVEKADGELYDLLLQILDKGEVSLMNKGRKASFKKAIVIFTSNLGSKEISQLLGGGYGFRPGNAPEATREQVEKKAKGALVTHFRPEFLGRVKDKIVFNSLNDQELGTVLDRHVQKVNKDYATKSGITLVLAPEVRDAIIASCEDRKIYNGRPVIDKFEDTVESLLGDYINSGGISEGCHVYVGFSGDMPADAPLEERLEFRYNPNEVPSTVSRADRNKHKKERTKEVANLPAVINNSNFAISLAAAAGIAALFVGDYVSSRRSRRAY